MLTLFAIPALGFLVIASLTLFDWVQDRV